METLSLIVGYAGTLVNIVAFQVKNRKTLLLFQIISNLLPAISFMLLGMEKMIGGAVAFVASFHTAVTYYYSQKGSVPPWAPSALFIGLYAVASFLPSVIAGGIGLLDLFPFLTGVIYVFALREPRIENARWFFFTNLILWILYDCLGEKVAVANLITHCITLGSIIISIIRYNFILPARERKVKQDHAEGS